MAVYRFQFQGVTPEDLAEHLPLGVVTSVDFAKPTVTLDVTVNPIAPGSATEEDLVAVMRERGWAFVAIV